MHTPKQKDVRLLDNYANLGEQTRRLRNAIRHTPISWQTTRECVKIGIRTKYDYLALR